jgi:hypothetical protein
MSYDQNGLLGELSQHFLEQRQAWRQLDAVTQNKIRASHGFALVVMTMAGVGGLCFLYGWHIVPDYFDRLYRDPAHEWREAALVGGLIVFGLTRGLIGARRLAGLRDGTHTGKELMRLLIGGSVAVWLARLYPWPAGTDLWVVVGGLIVFAIAAFNALIGFFALLVLWLPLGGNALARVNRHIQQTQVVMRPVRSRPWWQFW